ncbi:MAG: NAD(P)H-dependent oxidoreductase subunit E, partial [Pseudomonadota bacterium]
GTTSCMICGAEDLIAVCKDKIAPEPHQISADGKFSWEEVECLGACANAPMAQIGKDYYEDLTSERFGEILDAFGRGEVPRPGPQTGRFASEPLSGLTSLAEMSGHSANASVERAQAWGDTVKRITGDETGAPAPRAKPAPVKAKGRAKDATPAKEITAKDPAPARPKVDKKAQAKEASPSAATKPATPAAHVGTKPDALDGPRAGGADDLKRIKGIGPKLEKLCNSLGFYHFDQVANWTPDEVAWVDQNLEGFKGRVSRDNWVGQAKLLAEGGETEFSAKVDKGGVY